MRTPTVLSGGYLPPELRGTNQSGFIHIADWYATLCALAGVDPADSVAAANGLPPIDSLNMWPLITGNTSSSPRVEYPISPSSFVSYPYKLLLGPQAFDAYSGEFYPNASSIALSTDVVGECGNGCLYNIEADPLEENDIAAANPQLVANMTARLAQLSQGFFSNNDTGVNLCPSGTIELCACWMATHVYGNFLGPFQE